MWYHLLLRNMKCITFFAKCINIRSVKASFTSYSIYIQMIRYVFRRSAFGLLPSVIAHSGNNLWFNRRVLRLNSYCQSNQKSTGMDWVVWRWGRQLMWQLNGYCKTQQLYHHKNYAFFAWEKVKMLALHKICPNGYLCTSSIRQLNLADSCLIILPQKRI